MYKLLFKVLLFLISFCCFYVSVKGDEDLYTFNLPLIDGKRSGPYHLTLHIDLLFLCSVGFVLVEGVLVWHRGDC